MAAIVILVWSIFPFFGLGLTSLLDEKEIAVKGAFIMPETVTPFNYRAALNLITEEEYTAHRVLLVGDVERVAPSFVNNIVVALSTSVLGIIISVVAGYAFGRYRFPAKTALLLVFLMTRMLPPIAIIIPYFSIFNVLGLHGTYQGVILTHLTLIVPLLTWVLMGYFATLPVETEKAARIDGCGRWKTLRHVMIPMGLSGIVATWILGFLLSWNELLFSLILTAATPIQTLQPSILGASPLSPDVTSGWGLISAIIMVSIIIPLILALVFQRYITRLNIVDPVSGMQ